MNGVLFNSDGFWRNNLSATFYECLPLKSACLGNNSDSTKICGDIYTGPLCQNCKKGFSKFFGGDCKICYSEDISISLIIAVFFLSVIVLGICFK